MSAYEDEQQESKELAFLLQQRNAIVNAREANSRLQQVIVQAMTCAPQALADLDSVRELLDLADAMHFHDDGQLSIVYVQKPLQVSLPYIKALDGLTSAAEELSDLRQLLVNAIWNKADDRCLEEAVLNQCRKIAFYQLRAERISTDPVGAVEMLTDQELSVYSLPRYMRPNDESESNAGNYTRPLPDGTKSVKHTAERIDWEEVSLCLSAAPTANAHTPDACRTRWLMVSRPGINHEPWHEDEIGKLKAEVQKQLESLKQGEQLNWYSVANAIGNARLPVDCVQAYQCLPFAVRYAPHLNLPPSPNQKGLYSDEMLRLASIWGPQWALLAEKLNYNPATIIDKFETALEAENEAREWSIAEIERLQEALDRSKSTWIHDVPGEVDSTRVSQADPSNTPANFDLIARFVRTRTPNACRERYLASHTMPRSASPPKTKSLISSHLWTDTEDENLLQLRCQNPDYLWTDIARKLRRNETGREVQRNITGPMARDRWLALEGRYEEGERERERKRDLRRRSARDRRNPKEKERERSHKRTATTGVGATREQSRADAAVVEEEEDEEDKAKTRQQVALQAAVGPARQAGRLRARKRSYVEQVQVQEGTVNVQTNGTASGRALRPKRALAKGASQGSG